MDHCAGLNLFSFKPGAVVVSARRAGTTATLDQMNKYLLYAQMPVVSSRYWNMVHGQTPEEVLEDKEGVQIMRVAGKKHGLASPVHAGGKRKGDFPSGAGGENQYKFYPLTAGIFCMPQSCTAMVFLFTCRFIQKN